MTTTNWTAANGNDWAGPNWSAGVPGPADTAIDNLGGSGADACFLFAPGVAWNLIVGAGASGVFVGTEAGISSVSLNVGHMSTIAGGVVVDDGDSFSTFNCDVSGVIETYYGNATISVTHSGTLEPGGLIYAQASADGGDTVSLSHFLNEGTIALDAANNSAPGDSYLLGDKFTNIGTIDLIGAQSGGPGSGTQCAQLGFAGGGSLVNAGEVDLTNDTTVLACNETGPGDFFLTHSTITFAKGFGTGGAVIFDGGNDVSHLILGHAESFFGTVEDFWRTGDTVVCKDFASFSTVLYAQTGADSCCFTLNDGTKTASINFAGEPYDVTDFAVGSTASGAVQIKLVGV